MTVHERLFKYAEITDACWLWRGCVDRKGYGRFTLTLPDGSRRFTRVHRVSYELFIGPLESDDQVDHVCEVRACFNPAHLQKCTLLENVHYRNHGRAQVPLILESAI